jgi:hypothetical protein
MDGLSRRGVRFWTKLLGFRFFVVMVTEPGMFKGNEVSGVRKGVP